MNTTELYQVIDDTADMLRGMMLDPTIPTHAKAAIQCKITTLEYTLEQMLVEINGK